jgi:hypothetical protein
MLNVIDMQNLIDMQNYIDIRGKAEETIQDPRSMRFRPIHQPLAMQIHPRFDLFKNV